MSDGLILLDAGPSRRGWSRLGTFLRCPQLFAYKYKMRAANIGDAGGEVTLGGGDSAALLRGSLLHLALAHHYAEHLPDARTYYRWADAVDVACDRRPELAPYKDTVLATMGHYRRKWGDDRDVFEVLAVEQELAAHLGTLDCPGHPEHGKLILYTQRIDLIVRMRNSGLVALVDHKCLPSNAMVHTTKGVMSIGLLGEGEHRVMTLRRHDDKRHIETAEARIFRAGEQPIVRLTLENGLVADLGANHPVRAERGWTPAARLSYGVHGDRVAVALGGPASRPAHVLDSDLTALPLLVCDGSFDTKRSTIKFYKNDSRVRDMMRDALLDMRVRDVHEWKSPTVAIMQINSNDSARIFARMEALSIPACSSSERHLGDLAHTSGDDARTVLAALWSGDGAAYIVRAGSRASVRIVYSCRSERLARQVQHLLLRAGYPATFTTSSVAYRGGRRPTYTATVVTAEGKRRFLQDVIVDRLYCPALKSGGELTRGGNIKPSAERILAEVNAHNDKSVEDDVWWVPVSHVVPKGTEPVWDVTLLNTDNYEDQNFVAEGLVTHNSTGRISATTVDAYSIHGQFHGMHMLGRLYYPADYGGCMLNLVEWPKDGKCSMQRPPLHGAPHLTAEFFDNAVQAEHAIARLERDTESPWRWPKAMHEMVCLTRYGRCDALELCMKGKFSNA